MMIIVSLIDRDTNTTYIVYQKKAQQVQMQ